MKKEKTIQSEFAKRIIEKHLPPKYGREVRKRAGLIADGIIDCYNYGVPLLLLKKQMDSFLESIENKRDATLSMFLEFIVKKADKYDDTKETITKLIKDYEEKFGHLGS